MTYNKECNSTKRDKYNRCLDCGKEIFAGYARIIIKEEGKIVKEFDKYVVGHV